MSEPITKKNKILFFTTSLDGGGAERVIAHLLRGIDRSRYIPELVILEDVIKYDLPEDIEITCLDKKRPVDFFKMLFKLSGILKEKQPDIAISFLDYANIILVLAKYLSGFRGKVILSERNNPVLSIKNRKKQKWTYELLKTKAYQKADIITTVSDGVSECLIEEFDLPANKLVTIHNGVDHERIELLSREDSSGVAFKPDSVNFIAIGRLIEQKAYSDMLKAVSVVAKKRNITLSILGCGEQEQLLKKRCQELGLENIVSFLGFQKNPFIFMCNADIFLLSSHWEGCSNALNEAMACGLPVISTDCPYGPNEIIKNGKNGILVPVGDIDAMADAMLKLIDDNGLKEQIAEQGKIRSQDFTVSKMVGEYEDVLDSLCEKDNSFFSIS